MSQVAASSLLLYGPTGSYKTSQVVEFAKYVWEKTGKMTRVVTAEPAGVDILNPAIQAGMIEPLYINKLSQPRSLLAKIRRGDWSVAVDAARNPTNDMDKAVGYMTLPTPPEKAARIGGYAFEGCTSIGELCLYDLADKNAPKMDVDGKSLPNAIEMQDKTGLRGTGYWEDGVVLGGTSQSQYGAAQKDVLQLLKEAPSALYKASKGSVQYCMFTAHESKGLDKETMTPMYGPGVVGQAATARIGKEIGTMLHLEPGWKEVPAQGGGKVRVRVVRAFFRDHPDTENPNILWTAKPRIPPTAQAIAELDKRFPGGFFELSLQPEQTLYHFLKFQDQLQAAAEAALKAMMAKAQPAT